MDIQNPATGEEFVLGLKEITLPDGVTRPYSMWLSATPPRPGRPDRILSLDMRHGPGLDRHELRKLTDYPEPLGDFMAFVPGTQPSAELASTVAYLAALIITATPCSA